MLGRVVGWLALTLGGTLLAGLFVLVQALDQQPLVGPPAAASPAQVQTARAVAKRALRLIQRAEPGQIVIRGEELLALPSLATRAYPRLSTQVQAHAGGLSLAASLRLPDTPLGRYLSLSARLPAGRPLTLEQLQLGRLRVPDRLVAWLLPSTLDLLLGQAQRRVLLEGVQIVSASPQRLVLAIVPPPNPGQHLSQLLERLRGLGGNEPHLHQAWIGRYYQSLLQQAATLTPEQWVSVSYFIGPLFREVAQRAPEGEEHRHSRAAILALALYLGSRQFEQLTGPVLSDAQRQARLHGRTLLRGRIDLRQHFIYSAALQVLGEEGLSYAIGEFKELLDANRGGSGFSFADLAADRAGTRFALTATASAEQARQFLRHFAPPLREADLMIPIDRLPEGLTEEAFRSAYRDIDSPRYRDLVARIDRQLLDLRLYRPDAE